MFFKSSLFTLIILWGFAECLCQQRSGYMTVVAPSTVRSNSMYNIAVSLVNFHQSSWLNVSLSGSNLNVQHTIEVEPGTTKLVSLKVPEVNALDGKLKVVGFRGIVWNDIVTVSVSKLKYLVYIQTDKPIYKPGEVVRFRVICIDELTRPAPVNEPLDVLIYNSENIVIKKIPNVKLFQGVFRGELNLSQYTKSGEWNIEVKGSSSRKRAKFEVSRYTLPKFKVEIVAKSDVSLTDGSVELVVNALYTDDKPIKGRLSIKLIVQNLINHSEEEKHLNSKINNGQSKITLDFESDLNINKTRREVRLRRLYIVYVEVEVKDFLTNELLKDTTQIKIYSHPYRVELVAPQAFESNILVEIKVLVRNLQNDRIQDSINPVKIYLQSYEEMGFERSEDVFLKDGFGVAYFNLSDLNINEYVLSAEYNGCQSTWSTLKKLQESNFHLNVLTQSPEIGKEFMIELKSKTPIDHFIYEIIARGNILLTRGVKVGANATTHQLRVNATPVMVPKVTIFVHRVKDNKFDSQLKDVYISKSFENSIQVTAEHEVKPGASVSINVTTDEGSYVGLMAVDDRLLLRSEGNGDLTQSNVFTRLKEYDATYMDSEIRPGATAGLMTLINIKIPGFEPIIEQRADEDDVPKIDFEPEVDWPRLRELFGDAWLFEDFKRTPREGLQLRAICPDAIASWAITGFSLNPETGLSLTRNATKLDVFASFYLSMDLPESLKEGETIKIPVYVFNYLKQDVETKVKFESQSEHLLVLESVDGYSSFEATQTLLLPKSGRVRLTFIVKPKISGEFNVTVSAISALASDALRKTLTVEPEGIPHFTSKTILVHLQDAKLEDTISVNVSTKAVRGSESIELSVVGDAFGPLVESLENLSRVPHGTGKEINTHFIANTLVLKYLKTFNHSNPSLEARCLRFLEIGYQNLLQLKQMDGSFSVVDVWPERTGDTMQTAIVLWGLQQAKSFIEIDESVIERGLEHLSKKSKSGSFTTNNGLEDDVILTSFVLLAFLANSAPTDMHKEVISLGIEYLYAVQSILNNPPSEAIAAYVLILAKHEKSGELLSKLNNQAAVPGQEVLFGRTDSLQSNLEMTAGSFLYLLRSFPQQTESLFPIVNILLVSKLSGKIPTHLLALDAMIVIGKSMDFGSKSLSLRFKSDEEEIANLSVDPSNVHVTQSIQLKNVTRSVKLQISGKGFAVVNIKYRCNLLQAHAPAAPNYRTNVTGLDRRGPLVALKVCVAVHSSKRISKFTVLEVNLPSGYAVLETSLGHLSNEQIMSIKVNGKEYSVLATIKDITQAGTCVELQALRTFSVFHAKPMSTVVYDFYNENVKTTSLHELDFENIPGESDFDWR